jgi:hypothetical protein
MSFNYPINPTESDKKHYMDFIKSMRYILPCGKCRSNLKKNLELLPLTKDKMVSRESFSKYVFDLHEVINKMLCKVSGLSYEDVRETYEHFRARCVDSKVVDEKGCVVPYYGKKKKCVLRVVAQSKKCKSFSVE